MGKSYTAAVSMHEGGMGMSIIISKPQRLRKPSRAERAGKRDAELSSIRFLFQLQLSCPSDEPYSTLSISSSLYPKFTYFIFFSQLPQRPPPSLPSSSPATSKLEHSLTHSLTPIAYILNTAALTYSIRSIYEIRVLSIHQFQYIDTLLRFIIRLNFQEKT